MRIELRWGWKEIGLIKRSIILKRLLCVHMMPVTSSLIAMTNSVTSVESGVISFAGDSQYYLHRCEAVLSEKSSSSVASDRINAFPTTDFDCLFIR